MVPVIAANGASFRGAFQYYCHDKRGRTTERIEWTQTVNMLTDCVSNAWKVMAYTAKHQDRLKDVSGQKATGAKTKKPVFAFSLSWAPEQQPDKKTMLDAARQALAALGLSDHQAIIVAHNDRPHSHVHIVANTIHPLTGLVAKLKYTKRKLSDFALQYEQEHGKIYCQQRVANRKQREAGRTTRYCDPNIVGAWTSTNTDEGFVAALAAKGYRLAQGRKRLVIIDPHGKAHNPIRHLDGVKAREFNERLSGHDLSLLPDAVAPVQEKKVETAEYPPPQKNEAPSKPQEDAQALLERRASSERDALARRHADEQARMTAQQKDRLSFSRRQLMDFYQLENRKAELAKLKSQLEKAPWWKKLLGLAKKERQAFKEELGAYRTASMACREKLRSIAEQNREGLDRLTKRQSKECLDMEMRFVRKQAALHEPERELSQPFRAVVHTRGQDQEGRTDGFGDKIPRSHDNARKSRSGPSYDL